MMANEPPVSDEDDEDAEFTPDMMMKLLSAYNPDTGFVLLQFEMNNPARCYCQTLSNVNLDDVCAAMREWIAIHERRQ